jgi:TP901 family phage tail tape measure protein
MAKKKVEIEVSAIDKASLVFKKVGNSTEQLKKKLSGLSGGLAEGFSGIGAAGIGSVIAGLGAGAGLAGVMQQTVEYQSALVDMAKVSDQSFSTVREQIHALNPEFGTQTELVRAYYQAMSSGVTDAAQALDLVEVAAKSAKAAHTDQGQVIQALTALMAGYEGKLTDVATAADLLFTTEKQGKTSVQALVPIIGDIASISNQAGISFDEMAAGFSAVTLTAGSSSVAATRFREMLINVIKPTQDMEKAITALGYADGKKLFQDKGLAGGLQAIAVYAEKSGVALTKLFSSSEALLSLDQFLKDDFRQFSLNMDSMSQKTGAMNRAWENYRVTLEGLWDTSKNLASGLSIDFGMVITPGAEEGLKGLNATLEFLSKNLHAILAVVGASGTVWVGHAAAVKLLTASLTDNQRQEIAAAGAAMRLAQQEELLAAAKMRHVDATAKSLIGTAQEERAAALLATQQAKLAAASTAAAAAEARFAVAMNASTGKAALLSNAMGALNTVRAAGMGLLNLLGGPLNAALMLGAGAVALLATRQTEAEKAAEQHTSAQEDLQRALRGMASTSEAANGELSKTSQILREQASIKAAESVKTQVSTIKSALETLNTVEVSGIVMSIDRGAQQETLNALRTMLDEVVSGTVKAEDFSEAVASATEELKNNGLEGSDVYKLLSSMLGKPIQDLISYQKTLREATGEFNKMAGAASSAASSVGTLGSALDRIDPSKMQSALTDARWTVYLNKLSGVQKAKAEAAKRLGLDTEGYQNLLSNKNSQSKEFQELMQLSGEGYVPPKNAGKSGASQIASAKEKLQELREEIARMNGEASKAGGELAKKLRDIAEAGGKAKLSAGEIATMQADFTQAFQADALREFDKELATLTNDTQKLNAIETADTLREWQNKFADIGLSAEESAPKIAALKAALEQESHIKDLQAAANFYQELAEKTGEYGTSLEYQNQLLDKQKAIWLGMGIPLQDVTEMLKQQRLEMEELIATNARFATVTARTKELERDNYYDSPLAGMELSLLDYSRDAFAFRDQMRESFTSMFGTISDAGTSAFQTIFTGGTFEANKFFANLTAQLAAQAAAAAGNSLIKGIFGMLGNALMSGFTGSLGQNMFTGTAPLMAIPGGTSWSSPIAAMHDGGVVGQDASFSRAMPLSLWEHAPRYHTGGTTGFMPDELPIIAQRGETILSRADSGSIGAKLDAIANLLAAMQSALGTQGNSGGSTSVVLVDDQRKVKDYLLSPEGGRTFVTLLNNNRQSIKNISNGGRA